MTIEVRQMVIKSSVGDDNSTGERKPSSCCGDDQDTREFKDDMLTQCRAMMLEQLERMRER